MWLDDATEVSEAKSWLRRAIRKRVGALPAADDDPIPEKVKGTNVADVVEACARILHAECDVVWPGFSRVIVDALEDGACPTRHICPVMTQAKHYGVTRIHTAGWFSKAIIGLRGRTVAVPGREVAA
jgi:hypothetical protein